MRSSIVKFSWKVFKRESCESLSFVNVYFVGVFVLLLWFFFQNKELFSLSISYNRTYLRRVSTESDIQPANQVFLAVLLPF